MLRVYRACIYECSKKREMSASYCNHLSRVKSWNQRYNSPLSQNSPPHSENWQRKPEGALNLLGKEGGLNGKGREDPGFVIGPVLGGYDACFHHYHDKARNLTLLPNYFFTIPNLGRVYGTRHIRTTPAWQYSTNILDGVGEVGGSFTDDIHKSMQDKHCPLLYANLRASSRLYGLPCLLLSISIPKV